MADTTGNAALQPNRSPTVAQAGVVRDDRILPETRLIAMFIPPFLVVAFIMLFFFPNNTTETFAWTIKPTMTPLLMGAGYISGSYFFIRLIMGGKWHWFTLGFLPIATFTWFMGLATVLHWDKFNHNHISFYAWLLLYVVTPFLVPALWLRNRVTDPGTPDVGDVEVPLIVRQVTGVIGAVMVALAVFMFVLPDVAISVWPWKLTPLTTRVIAGWFALPGVVGLTFASDSRWSAWRITLQSQLAGVTLILIGVVRAWGDLNQGNAMTWVFLAGMIGLLAYLLAIYIAMESRRRNVTAAAGPPEQARS